MKDDKLLPDLSWAKPLSEEALLLLKDFRVSINDKLPQIFWGGFWHGAVTVALVMICTFVVVTRWKQRG